MHMEKAGHFTMNMSIRSLLMQFDKTFTDRTCYKVPGRELLPSDHICDAVAPNSCLWILCIKITK
jgi:hypothetical protein